MTRATPDRPNRRSLLTGTLGALAGAAGFALATPATADVGVQATQWGWRFCDKCYMLFYWGYPENGVCPAGGEHRAQGWNFMLSYNVPGDANHQRGWRFCLKCYGLYWEPGKEGTCPAGGWHLAQGFVFTVSHGLPETSTRQQGWRHCWNCTAMFYSGFVPKGVCGAGGRGHDAEGFSFCLYHS